MSDCIKESFNDRGPVAKHLEMYLSNLQQELKKIHEYMSNLQRIPKIEERNERDTTCILKYKMVRSHNGGQRTKRRLRL